MTYPTHRRYGIGVALIGCMILYATGIRNINYYLMLSIALQYSKMGALLPDVDHDWEYVKEKTVPNFIFNKLIHLTGGKHRSRHTHSVDITVIINIIAWVLPKYLFEINVLTNEVDMVLLSTMLVGLGMGLISHIICDALNGVGVYLFCWGKWKVSLLPTKILAIRFKNKSLRWLNKPLHKLDREINSNFHTGGVWESLVEKVAKYTNIVLGILAIIFPYIIK